MTIQEADALYVNIVGDVMTGFLTLNADPTADLHAATKKYVDDNSTTGGPFVQVSGDTMTGVLTILAPGSGSQIVLHDNTAMGSAIRFHGTPPDSWEIGARSDNSFFFRRRDAARDAITLSAAAVVEVNYPLMLEADPTAPLEAATKQYVDTVAGDFLPLAGGTMTGPIVLAGNPIANLEATAKQYVDAGDKYRGSYAPSTNVPDLSVLPTFDQHMWVVLLADPSIPEATIIALPGIPLGTLMYDGDAISWSLVNGVYSHIQSSGVTVPEGDARWVLKTGDTMTGELRFQGSNRGVTLHYGARFWLPDDPSRGTTIREGSAGHQPQIENNDGSNVRDIIDTINGDARYAPRAALDTMEAIMQQLEARVAQLEAR
jgi:hypothetical protein